MESLREGNFRWHIWQTFMTTQSDSLENRKTIICHHAFLISIQWFLFVERDAAEAIRKQTPQYENPMPNITFRTIPINHSQVFCSCCVVATFSSCQKLNHEFVIYKRSQLASIRWNGDLRLKISSYWCCSLWKIAFCEGESVAHSDSLKQSIKISCEFPPMFSNGFSRVFLIPIGFLIFIFPAASKNQNLQS